MPNDQGHNPLAGSKAEVVVQDITIPVNYRELPAPAIDSSPTSSTSITISLASPSDPDARYRLLRSTDGGAYVEVARQLEASAFPYVDDGLTAGTPHDHLVEADNGWGKKLSAVKSATTAAEPVGSAPTAPVYTISPVATSAQFVVSQANGATSYEYQVIDSGGAFGVDGISGTNAGGLTAESPYVGRLRGVNEFGVGPWGAEISFNTTAVSALYPNKPAWATTDILSVDGTVSEGADGSAFGIPAFGGWFGVRGGGAQRVTVVADADNPLGNNSAINFEWIDSESATAGSSDLGPSSTGYNRLYIVFRVKLVEEGWTGGGHKFFYFGAQGGSKTQHYFDRPGGGNPERLRLINQDGVAENTTVMMDTFGNAGVKPLVIGQVLNIEVVVDRLAETTQCWVNGTYSGGRTINPPDAPFNKAEWYGRANNGSFSQTVNMRLYEWYMAGEVA